MRRNFLLGAVAVVVLVCVVIASRGGSHVLPPPSDAAAEPRPADQLVDVVRAGTNVEGSASREDVEAPGPAAPMPVSETAPGSRPTRRFEGTITVMDPTGAVHESESGTAHFVVWLSQTGGGGIGAAVEDGRWTIDYPVGDVEPLRLSLARCDLGGRSVLLEDQFVELPHEGEIAFAGRWLPRSTLRVLDAGSGMDLVGVRVVAGLGFPFSELSHPSGRAARKVASGDSPLTLPDPEVMFAGRQRVWVCAPGYAWQCERVDYAQGGEHRVELHAGAHLDVWLTGAEPPAEAVLRVYRAGAAGPYADLAPAHDRATAIDGLAPGAYRVRLQVGPWFRGPLDLAQADVELAPGESRTIELQVETAIEAPDSVLVHGTVRIPPGWRARDSTVITMQPEGEVTRWDSEWKHARFRSFEPTDDPDVFFWRIGMLVPGTYMLTVDPTEHRELVEIRPGGPNVLAVAASDPADVAVRLFDAVTGARADVKHIAWNGPIPGKVSGWGMETATFDEEVGGYAFQAPIGEIRIRVNGAGYEQLVERVAVVPGHNEFVLRLSPSK